MRVKKFLEMDNVKYIILILYYFPPNREHDLFVMDPFTSQRLEIFNFFHFIYFFILAKYEP